MDYIKSFKEYKNSNVNENYEVNQYQYMINKLFNEIGVQLYYAPTYGTSLTTLIPMIDKLVNNDNIILSMENIILITIFAVSVLCKENKEKSSVIFELLIDKGVSEEIIDKIIMFFYNLEITFNEVITLLEKSIEKFSDMLAYTSVFVPFTSIMKSIIEKNQYNIELFYKPIEVFKKSLDTMEFKILMDKIMRKLMIMMNHNDKFLNKDNVDILLADQELKSPQYKTTKFNAE